MYASEIFASILQLPLQQARRYNPSTQQSSQRWKSVDRPLPPQTTDQQVTQYPFSAFTIKQRDPVNFKITRTSGYNFQNTTTKKQNRDFSVFILIAEQIFFIFQKQVQKKC